MYLRVYLKLSKFSGCMTRLEKFAPSAVFELVLREGPNGLVAFTVIG